MLYRDLVQFDPIESVIQLRSADEKAAAARLVQTYVISDRMADQLAHVVIPQLRIDQPLDNKGVLVVGNYGTGKSHLMSVLSALAEYSDLVPLVRNAEARDAAAAIGGKFRVVRGEIGGVTMPLREIVLGELEDFFKRAETPYTFPPASQVSNNKDTLIEAMGRFNARYPDQGVLFVLDELLDFLRSREERELILDLGFLRELGEVTAATTFRFIAGVQETLFDNPRFGFVAESIRRVRDRFEQVRIAREDIAYVVAQRLLGKNDEQLARITAHLRRFSALYPQMADRLAEYVRLFPIHPAYIDTFERVYVAEKREVLQTFSRAIRAMLDQQVPDDQPGVISYDQYWDVLRGNPSLRTLPGVAEVVQKSDILLGRVENAYTRPPLKPMALRIIHALSVQRLTSELDTPLGVTADELRDQLCLWVRMPEATADFLAGQVQVALKEIQRTVNGQYISFNPDNGQYYLDLKKDIDFDARIEERGAFLDRRDLNKYFYNALQGLLNLSTSTYVSNFRIWPYELPWDAKRVTRPGYLFLSSPQERSTAQPPRDFYLYFLPPFDPPSGKVEPRPDEAIFALEGTGAEFEELVRRYAGAQALADESPNNRQVYADKAAQSLRALSAWLRDHLRTQLRVTHNGATQTVAQALAHTRSSASADLEELLRVIAGHLLEPHFRDTYPDYPAFTRLREPISEKAREAAARDAALFLARGARTNLALGVLHGLGLLSDDEKVRTDNSPYARSFLEQLEAKPAGQVVNRGEMLTQVASGTVPVFKDPRFQLEPEWVTVVLLALVYDGRITLNLGKETLDAGSIERAALHTMDTLVDFRFYRRPQALPVYEWKQIFEALGLQAGLVQDDGARDEAVVRLQERVSAELPQVAETLSRVQAGMSVWGAPLFTDNLTFTVQRGVVEPTSHAVTLTSTEILPHLRRAKEFLEKLQAFNTPGKMRNLALTSDDLNKALHARQIAQRVAETLRALSSVQELTAYLAQAQTLLPQSHPWQAQAEPVQRELLETARRDLHAGQPFDASAWRTRLTTLRQAYVTTYAELHQQYTLGPDEDDRRARLLRDDRYTRMRALAQIDVLNGPELKQWQDALVALPACRDFHPQLLDSAAQCPRCHFHPAQQAGGPFAASRLQQLDDQLTLTLQQWESALRTNLESETVKASRQSMTVAERSAVERYLASPGADAALPSGFVDAANQALRGLRMVRLGADDVLAALALGGFPCTEGELRQRFEALLRERMQGFDARNTRLAIEQVDSMTGPLVAVTKAAQVVKRD